MNSTNIVKRFQTRKGYSDEELRRGVPAVEFAIKEMEHQKMEEPEIRETLQDNGVPGQVVDNTYDNRERKLIKHTTKDDDVEIREAGE